VLRVKARLFGTSCELEKGWVCLGVSGGGEYFVTREKGQGQWRGGGRMDIFGTKGKSQLGRPTTANAFSR